MISDRESGTDHCPFCDYRGPSSVLLDAGDCIVIEPLKPVVPGHVIVIPKEHVPDALDTPRVAEAAMFVAASWARTRRDQGGCQDWNIITSAGRAATQTVPHLHIHVVPRKEGDGLMLPWSGQQFSGYLDYLDSALEAAEKAGQMAAVRRVGLREMRRV